MAKKPPAPPPSAVEQIRLWLVDRLTMLAWGCGILIALAGAATAWPKIEWMMVAHRGFVTDQVGSVQTPINELLIWKFEDVKNKARADYSDWEIKRTKEPDADTQRKIQKRIDELKDVEQQADKRIKKLKGE